MQTYHYRNSLFCAGFVRTLYDGMESELVLLLLLLGCYFRVAQRQQSGDEEVQAEGEKWACLERF